ncbi:MAG: alpha/beta fold hydrolase, partial [Deltaproteobacteria bacterium]|nr:alpha/beta fold hydrolase [Deltaproteobacteria bacterium]
MKKRDKLAPPFRDEYADVNGVRLHYVSTGRGKPILFLHGFPEFWYCWKNQLEHFGKDYMALALDMRGSNLSSKPADAHQYRLETLAEDLKGLTVRLGLKKLTAVGHDWGGVTAWVFANRYPEYLEKLIIINAPHPGLFARILAAKPEQQQASQYMLYFRSPDAEKILSENNYARLFMAMLGNRGGANYSLSLEDKKKYVQAWSQPGALTGGLNYYRAAPYTSLV